MVTNEIGKPENSYQYSPFGSLINGEGDSVNALRFVGRYGGYSDDDTGLIYFWHRWYDAEDGRWVSRDPIGEPKNIWKCNKQTILGNDMTNSYEYVWNNPRKFVDRTGHVGEDADGNMSNSRGNVNGEGLEVRYNYCGKNYSNGKMHVSWRDEGNFSAPALNPTDKCCKEHDKCSIAVLNQHFNKKLAPAPYNCMTITDCNKGLSNCFAGVNSFYSFLGNRYFGNINPRAGDPGHATY